MSAALTIIGGLGYVGKAIVKEASKKGINVYCVSRSASSKLEALGEGYENVKAIDADAMDPKSYSSALKDSKGIIHLVGTLVSKAAPGEKGSYEYMNRDTAISLSNYLLENNLKKRFVYMGSAKSPPFLHRYISTKREAEENLKANPNLKAILLRPGFIYSATERPISIPLKFIIGLNKSLYTPIVDFLPNTPFKEFLHEFSFTETVELEELARVSVKAAMEDSFLTGTFENDSIIYYSKTP